MLSAFSLYFLVGLAGLLYDVTYGDCDLASYDREAFRIEACLNNHGIAITLAEPSAASNGSSCRVTCLDDGTDRKMTCTSSIWAFEPSVCGGGTKGLVVRKKRFFGLFVALFVVILFSGRSGPPPDRSPPRVFCPPDIHRYADPIQTSTRIHWDESVAYAIDNKDGRISASRWSRKGPYYVFWGVTNVVYHARDRAGNSGHCDMKITVTTIRCSPGPSKTFKNGYYMCHPSSDFVYGTACNYGCYYGYRIAGQKRRECLKSGRWSSVEPQCEVVTCEPPEPFLDGTFQFTNGYNFKSACSYSCNPGYDVTPGKSRVRVCGYDGQWRGAVPECKDSEPPEFTDCPRVMTFFTERGSSMALVDWVVPSVTDNSQQTIIPTQTPGISNTDYHPSGVYDVVYNAVDAAGNEARPCKFKVVVKELKCFAQYPLPYMKVDCPSGYRHGAMCDYSCESGYAINGSTTATCEKSGTYPPYAYWKITRQPSCQALNTCPTLTPPDNGALACDLWEDGSFCQLQCMKGTDIPPSFTAWKLFVCNTNGAWNYDGNIPPCSKIRNTRFTRKTANIYYFEGSCSEEAVLEIIKENFLRALQESPFNSSIDRDDMSVENVKVTCGAVRDKRSTDSHRVRVQCDIVGTMTESESKDAFKDSEKRSYDLLQMIEEDTKGDNSKLLPQLDPASRATVQVDNTDVELDCPDGTLPSYRTWSCADCTAGTYFLSNQCEPCALGFYQPQQGQTECLKCPPGTTTLKQEARSVEECLPQCPLGHFSANGVEPCTPCDLGKYAEETGSTTCTTCPVSTTTMQQGSTGLASCKHFDISLSDMDTSQAKLEVSVDSFDPSTGFSLRLWVMFTCETGGDIMTFTSSGDDLFSLHTDKQLHLQFSVSTALGFNLEVDTWYQIHVNYDSSILTVYVDGKKVFEEPKTEATWTLTNSLNLIIGGNGFQGSVSQVNMWRSPQTITSTGQPSCFTNDTGDVLAWGSFTNANMTEAFLQIPSECDDTDECLSGPCVHGNCTNILNDYTCSCDEGYRGSDCDVNMDDCVDHQCTNEGTCVDGVSNYTCVCTPDYTGEFCDANLVNGGWGVWGNWTDCSTTCGPGKRTRVRRCDNPLPQNGGASCSGPDKDTGSCSDSQCPKCSVLDPPTNGKLMCADEVGMRRCELVCDEGYDFDREPLPVYECGEETGYEWNFMTQDNPVGRFPNCMEIKPPSEMEIEYAATYVDLDCETNHDATQTISTAVQQEANRIPCVKDKSCYIKGIRVNKNCDNSRQKRNIVLANFIIILANNPSSIGIQSSLQDLNTALLQLNSSVQTGVFTVTIGGVQYYLTPSPHTSGQVRCKTVWTRVNYYCVPCGPGTFYINGYCERCDNGRYSNGTGVTFCHSCPEGKSTPGRASLSVEECTVDVSIPADLLLAAILPGVIVPALLTAIGLAIYFCYKWKKRQAKVRDMKATNPLGPVIEAWGPFPNVAPLACSLPERKKKRDCDFPVKVFTLKTDLSTEDLEAESSSTA